MDAKLVTFKPDGTRIDIPLTAQSTLVGRSENCTLRIPFASVSRQHCEIAMEGEEIRVRDLGSSNGTYVNNNRVSEVRMAAGDRLALGEMTFVLQVDGEPPEIEPVRPAPVQPAESAEAPPEDAAAALAAAVAAPASGPGDEGPEAPLPLTDIAGGEDEEAADPFAALGEETTSKAEDEELGAISALEMLAGEGSAETETEDEETEES